MDRSRTAEPGRPPTPQTPLPRAPRHQVGQEWAKDIDAWADLWAPSGRIIVFHPSEGFASTIDGKDAIVGGFRPLFATSDTFDCELTGIYPAAESDAVTVEYDVDATLRDGTVYRNRNITVFRFDGDLISEYHDYFDPRLFQKVVDVLPGQSRPSRR